ncbi:alpha/beta hydrolase [Natronolimnohabitans innermongolicus]|uniref:Hydrolase of the alpha/beta superfamily-like protein n=1 Tax=Natronolimnohabitans innermongolicus JCM 12255 TaxID=1227499 RepID=L9XAJ4_9EURY|nr:CocE/NonD family hydrolase [Natronolimnohabitans innermongolicus]ELY58769.1 hydrolase of the alpha/beta superfamily-like protein [Natronolimnohabitans innermongolicus JCM 12255]
MTDVLVPGGRDVRGTLEEPTDGADAIVVACPPHPQHGGSRSDGRLTAVSDALVDRGIACLRFDYGSWDEGYGERADVRNAVRWAREEEYDRVGLFGYSFGATLSLLAASDLESPPDAVAVLAPTAQLAEDLDAFEALAGLETPVQIRYGERDTTVDWEPIVERARERGDDVAALSADHFFVGKHDTIAGDVAAFFERVLLESI